MTISILIPVFNAAGQLRRSLDSIAAQNVDVKMEIIAVDDCSYDSSPAILEDFKTAFEKTEGRTMTICRHDRNLGVACARNTALDAAGGDYICFVDADDTLAEQTLAKGIDAARRYDADVVGWDWTLCGQNSSRYMRQPDCTTTEEALKSFMGGTLRWNLWLFMAKRELWEGIRFTPGMNMGEDMMGMMGVMLKMRRFTQVHHFGYSYHQTSASISKTMSDTNLSQVCNNLGVVVESLRQSPYSHLEAPYVSFLKLNVKLPLLVSLDKNNYIRWSECFPEASAAIMRNHHLPLRTRLFQWMASRKMWGGVRFYNKLVYGLLCELLAFVR